MNLLLQIELKGTPEGGRGFFLAMLMTYLLKYLPPKPPALVSF